ncbi:hypothetical protein COMA1_10412 [Candidatus Nitrospira nitrosa]|uniref:Uncharacterized protein n=1 Tax=Candidatus Nitrospira nitrosa TaxID=1742972 RepID=A0A0S4L6A2_9BACT|nr:hypothetical protein COMA1_10412 [Candidatus Nitrospira nitrosa]
MDCKNYLQREKTLYIQSELKAGKINSWTGHRLEDKSTARLWCRLNGLARASQ